MFFWFKCNLEKIIVSIIYYVIIHKGYEDFELRKGDFAMDDKRIFRRIPFRNPVRFDSQKDVLVDGGSKTLKGGCVGCDLSKGGMQSNVTTFIPLNTSLLLNFSVEPRESIAIEGKVVWVQKAPSAENYRIGLQFVDSDVHVDSKIAIQKYLDKN